MSKTTGEPFPEAEQSPQKKARTDNKYSAALLPRTMDDVVEWARGDVGIADVHAQKLKAQEMDGEALARLAKDPRNDEKLERWGIPGGPALKLVGGLAELFPSQEHKIPIISGADGGWKIAGTVRSVTNPTLSFECEFGIDTRNHVGDISLPKKKVIELQLQPLGTRPCMTGGGPGTVTVYEPVVVELTDDKGTVHKFGANPFVTPHGDTIYNPIPASVPMGPAPQHGPVFQISPVKLPIPRSRPDIDVPLLGAPFLLRSGLGLDTKSGCFYTLIRLV